MNRAIILFAIILAMGPANSLAIECYECGSTINETNLESGPGKCSQVTGITLTGTSNFDFCSTQYVLDVTGRRKTTIIRSGGIGPKDTTCDSAVGGTTCWCTTNLCNNKAVSLPKSLECYDCESSDYFDNGCGEVLDTTSPYVTKVSGCSSCGKAVALQADYVLRYQRACTRTVNNDDNCYSDGPNSFCACQTALCNSAQKFQIITKSALFCVLIAALKIYY